MAMIRRRVLEERFAFSWDNASTGKVGQSKVKILFTPFRKTYFRRRQYHEVQN